MTRYAWLIVFGLVIAINGLVGCQTTQTEPDAATAAPAPTSATAVPEEATEPVAPLIEFPDTITLTNGSVEVGVSPKVGRIVWLSRKGGANLLWRTTAENGTPTRKGQWINYGGDKVWPAVQMLWSGANKTKGQWPPDGVIDGGKWTVIGVNRTSLTMESPISPNLAVQVTRRIQLDPDAPRITIRNTITRFEPNPYPAVVWSVSQVKHPKYTLLDVADDQPKIHKPYFDFNAFSRPNTEMIEVFDGAVQYTPVYDTGRKIGTTGRWVAAVYDDVALLHRTDYDPVAAYPDSSNMQIYSDSRYMEVETLSPQVQLKPGESLSNVVTWMLVDRKPNETAEDLAKRLAGMK